MEATTFLFQQIRKKRYQPLLFLRYHGYIIWFQVVLLLLLAEAMASKHVPLNQTPEYDTHRWFLSLKTHLGVNSTFTFILAHQCQFQGEHHDVSNSSIQPDEPGMCPVGSLQGCHWHVWEEFALLPQGELPVSGVTSTNTREEWLDVLLWWIIKFC